MYLLHGLLADPVRMLADTLQEVFEITHGSFLDVLSDHRNVVCHTLTEAIPSHPRQVGVFKLL